MRPACFPLCFFSFSFAIHRHKAMGAYYFVNPLERVTFRGLQRCQLTFTCYLKDATVSQVLSQVIGVFAV